MSSFRPNAKIKTEYRPPMNAEQQHEAAPKLICGM